MHDREADRPRARPVSARRRRALVLSVIVAATTAGLAWSGSELVAARHAERAALDQAAAASAVAEAEADELADRRARLLEAEAELGSTLRRLDETRALLTATVAERDRIVAELARVHAELALLQGAADGAELEAFANAVLVDALARCLDGVSELLNQVSVGDSGGAVRTLDRIGPACATVGTVLR